jgi:hypothetical protein
MNSHRLVSGWLAVGGLVMNLQAQELLYQEGFNDDGTVTVPPRYTVVGGFKSEAPHVAGTVGDAADQIGPVYWARSAEVSYVGVPAPTAGRRAALAWNAAIASGDIAPDVLTLVVNTVKWLASDKPNPVVAFTPSMTSAVGLVEALASRGIAVEDDPGGAEGAVTADVIIKAPGGSPSRFAASPKGVLNFSALDHDDLLLSSIGAQASFEAAGAEVVAAAHPIAVGVPAEFPMPAGVRTWELLGDTLPGGSTVVATFKRVIPPSVTSLADVEAMVAGTKEAIKATATVTELDFNDASPGDWFFDNPIPGSASGVWGLVARGQLQVGTAGTYSFALGMDDGARLRIDANRNGIGPEDTVIVEDAAGAHRARYGDVTFSATGMYEFEVLAFNSGGGGSLELSVSLLAGGNDTSPINSGSWEPLGFNFGAVTLSGVVTADSYVPSGPSEEVTAPLLMVLNGPNDTPPGSVFGGGPFEGFEGSGFFAGSGLNKWLAETIESLGGYRSVRLRPVNVAGKEDVKVTVALAATFLDFETNDFLDIVAYPNGVGGAEVRLARFSAPTGATKYFADVTRGNINQLGLRFIDATYDIPAGATDLVIEIRSFTSWWNEIVGFDNIRITSGAIATPLELGAPSVADAMVNLTWAGGEAPFLVQWSAALPPVWMDLRTASASPVSIPRVGPAGFVRVQSGAAGEVRLFQAALSGASEVPPVDTPATGSAWLSLSGDTLTYYVSYTGLKAVANAAHIHGPASTTTSAPPLFDLIPVPAFGTSGVLSGTRTLTAGQLTQLDNGELYINIHTSVHGGGEIRGQVMVVP